MNCPTCELPMVWSEWYQRMHCCVYGSHPARASSGLLERAALEMYPPGCLPGRPLRLVS